MVMGIKIVTLEERWLPFSWVKRMCTKDGRTYTYNTNGNIASVCLRSLCKQVFFNSAENDNQGLPQSEIFKEI